MPGFPEVIVILGSDSDLPVLAEMKIREIFDEIRVSHEVSIISADRHPEELRKYCLQKREDGAACFIGVAGLAPVLPGSIAAILENAVPVIGVALEEKGLYTIIGKPKGTVVLTTGVGKTALYNAALAACQIVGQKDRAVAEKLRDFMARHKKPAQINV
jgi:phosphoribosylaminoimidazole carboxylase PurE protein